MELSFEKACQEELERKKALCKGDATLTLMDKLRLSKERDAYLANKEFSKHKT